GPAVGRLAVAGRRVVGRRARGHRRERLFEFPALLLRPGVVVLTRRLTLARARRGGLLPLRRPLLPVLADHLAVGRVFIRAPVRPRLLRVLPPRRVPPPLLRGDRPRRHPLLAHPQAPLHAGLPLPPVSEVRNLIRIKVAAGLVQLQGQQGLLLHVET